MIIQFRIKYAVHSVLKFKLIETWNGFHCECDMVSVECEWFPTEQTDTKFQRNEINPSMQMHVRTCRQCNELACGTAMSLHVAAMQSR